MSKGQKAKILPPGRGTPLEHWDRALLGSNRSGRLAVYRYEFRHGYKDWQQYPILEPTLEQLSRFTSRKQVTAVNRSTHVGGP